MPVDHTKNSIEIHNVSFSYGNNEVLKNITFNIHSGDYLGVVGPNGSGKTTLIKLILGLLKLTKGEIKILGTPIDKFHDWSEIGYVAQKATSFDPKFPVTVRDVVAMGRFSHQGLFKRETNADKKLIESAIEQVELTPHKNKLIGDLSGGQQQRVFIARALSAQAKIIFLDEPTTGVDIHSQEQFYLLLEKLNRELGITLILISHDIDVVTREVTEVACINQTLVYHGNPEKFIKEDYLKKLYGEKMKFILHNHSV